MYLTIIWESACLSMSRCIETLTFALQNQLYSTARKLEFVESENLARTASLFLPWQGLINVYGDSSYETFKPLSAPRSVPKINLASVDRSVLTNSPVAISLYNAATEADPGK